MKIYLSYVYRKEVIKIDCKKKPSPTVMSMPACLTIGSWGTGRINFENNDRVCDIQKRNKD